VTEKLNRDLDNLTPLDARNSLLMDPIDASKRRRSGYDPVPPVDTAYHGRNGSSVEVRQGLLSDAASMGSRTVNRSVSPPASRAPRLPDIDVERGSPYQYGGRAY
jgi:hypothetical protein